MDAAVRAELVERTRYDAGAVENRIFERWQVAGAFDADPAAPGDPYCICLPPPNVTGSLHMGHALNGAIQDLLIRLKRMQGSNVLWQPGTDHAGIATQSVIERQLAAEGTTRQELGREAFVERVWAWRRETGSTIVEQYKRLGSSMDYRRERFTMDPGYERAVLDVFVALHERGYIYRGHRLVNWSWKLGTAISDLEVEHRDVDDVLYELAYDVEGGGEITLATVRPVTVLADVAVAVHPDDERYASLVGRHAIVPLVGRRVPIIADERVRREFGTGALKITPGHDPTDFEIGEAHGLEPLTMLGFDNRLTDLKPEWAGIDADEGHRRAVAALRAERRIRAETPYRHSVGHCSRSGVRVEPLISLQWFCRMDELAKPAAAAVRDGRVRFHPPGMASIFFGWMDAIRPWCVSRQLWWGHRLPVWFAPDGSYVVAVDEPEGDGFERSTDVLDTWFSSALWPFATLGWPDRTPELARWYPGNVLVTGRDIINLWVARMLMDGIEFAGDIPFCDVVINSTILAADGRRQSKSLGTGTDPLDLIDRYGADATRYGLLKMSSTQDVRFSEGALDEGRALANKVWNASRLVLTAADPEARAAASGAEPIDRFVLTRLAEVTTAVTGLYETFELSAAVKLLYAFVWNDVCDWYLEALKLRLYGDDGDARRTASETALFVLERMLALLHPVMPFVTEEIWSFLPRADERGLLMASRFPTAADVPVDADAAYGVGLAIAVVSALRRLRADAGMSPRAPLALTIAGDADAEALRAQAPLLHGLGHAQLRDTGDCRGGVPVVAGGARVLATGEGLGEALRARLARRLEDARGEHAKAESKLANPAFAERAPAAVVATERERAERFGREVEALAAQLAELGG